ncbi:Hypothetical protein, putative [Bodo saltans]|uniref:Uncharacterized protein n=1 Tax=Bodo saltans TaxID=75058 RepID=A0A0S4JIV8_BODSA|nr:Hypothetical protein, putative [Bodo saltans]|eukprot:CUG90095.1 Hypothetical protein, putative [Bodo saltans]
MLVPGGMRVVLIDANITVLCSSPNTPSSFIVFDLANNSYTDSVDVKVLPSHLSVAVTIWLSQQTVSLFVIRLRLFSTLPDQLTFASNISLLVSGASSVAFVGVLPPQETTNVNDSSVRILSIGTSTCNDIVAVINESCRLNLTLVRSDIAPFPRYVSLIRRYEVEVFWAGLSMSFSRGTLVLMDTAIVLRATTKGFAAITSPRIVDLDVCMSNVTMVIDVTPGFAGQQVKVISCVCLSATSNTVGVTALMRNISVLMEHVSVDSRLAVDGVISTTVTALIVSTEGGGSTNVVAILSHVHHSVSITGATLSSSSLTPLLNVVAFFATTTLLYLNGNLTDVTTRITNSHLVVTQWYMVPTGLATQYSASTIAMVYTPGVVISTTLEVQDSHIILLGLDKGIGATPSLSATTIASGSWNGNSVAILTTFSQIAVFGLLPPLMASFVRGIFGTTVAGNNTVATVDAPSLLDEVTIYFTNTSISSSNDDVTIELSDANLLISAFGLTSTSTRNGVMVVINNFSLLFVQRQLTDEAALQSTTCQQAHAIVTTGSGFAPIISVFGSCALEANTWIVVKGARGIVGPIVASYSLARRRQC